MVRRTADAGTRADRYVRAVTWLEHQLERLRSFDHQMVDAVMAAVMLLIALATVYTQDVVDGLAEPSALSLVTILAVSAPVAIRRVRPLLALVVTSLGVLVHIVADWPEGSLPFSAMLLTYTVAAWDTARRAALGLLAIYATLIALGLADTPGLDSLGVVANLALFTVAWTIGIALRARREAVDARVRAAEERANVERQAAARSIAEERLRIAQELHDVVAHSMSVIAVQAGVGAHVLADRPEQARVALEAISATSRGTLTEMRRLLGVLRDGEGERSDAPAPGLANVPRLVEDVRHAGVPVTLEINGSNDCVNAGVELSAYRVVQEALTNVIKHAGTPTRVDVRIDHLPGSLAVEVVDDGRGAAALARASSGDRRGAGEGSSEPAGPRLADDAGESGGHGLLGMRERVELWGGELSVGPVPGGGYRVRAVLPYGDDE